MTSAFPSCRNERQSSFHKRLNSRKRKYWVSHTAVVYAIELLELPNEIPMALISGLSSPSSSTLIVSVAAVAKNDLKYDTKGFPNCRDESWPKRLKLFLIDLCKARLDPHSYTNGRVAKRLSRRNAECGYLQAVKLPLLRHILSRNTSRTAL